MGGVGAIQGPVLLGVSTRSTRVSHKGGLHCLPLRPTGSGPSQIGSPHTTNSRRAQMLARTFERPDLGRPPPIDLHERTRGVKPPGLQGKWPNMCAVSRRRHTAVGRNHPHLATRFVATSSATRRARPPKPVFVLFLMAWACGPGWAREVERVEESKEGAGRERERDGAEALWCPGARPPRHSPGRLPQGALAGTLGRKSR